MTPLDRYFEQFVKERTYLNNITPKTREWYQTAWKAFKLPASRVAVAQLERAMVSAFGHQT